MSSAALFATFVERICDDARLYLAPSVWLAQNAGEKAIKAALAPAR